MATISTISANVRCHSLGADSWCWAGIASLIEHGNMKWSLTFDMHLDILVAVASIGHLVHVNDMWVAVVARADRSAPLSPVRIHCDSTGPVPQSLVAPLAAAATISMADIESIARMMPKPSTCEDCKGKGTIQLFTTTEQCRKCGGKGVC